MSTSEERRKILSMIAEGKITSEEGVQLLNVLTRSARKPRDAASPGGGANYLRIRVTDIPTGKVKVNVNIPISLVSIGLRMGARFAPDLEGTTMDEVLEAIERGVRGQIMDVTDGLDQERVEIFVE
jgi:hypothetical protein